MLDIPSAEQLKADRESVVASNVDDYNKSVSYVSEKITKANREGKTHVFVDMSGVGFGGKMIHFAMQHIATQKHLKVSVVKNKLSQSGCNEYKVSWSI